MERKKEEMEEGRKEGTKEGRREGKGWKERVARIRTNSSPRYSRRG